MKYLRKIKNQKGDTILEVLVVVAVLSLILTISYALANRSAQANRQAQERSEATKYTEAQIELVKTYLSKTAISALPASGSKFCMRSDGSPTAAIPGPIPDDAQADLTFSGYPPECKTDPLRTGITYNYYIQREGNTFTAYTRWVKVGGAGADEVSMIHRIYPDIASGPLSGGSWSSACPPGYFMNSIGGCDPIPPPTPQCRDRVDNDRDGSTDWPELGCVNSDDPDETNPPLPPLRIEAETFERVGPWYGVSYREDDPLSGGSPVGGFWFGFPSRVERDINVPNGFSSITVRASTDVYPEPSGHPQLMLEVFGGGPNSTVTQTIIAEPEPIYGTFTFNIAREPGTYRVRMGMVADECGCFFNGRGPTNANNTDRNLYIDWLEFNP